MVTALILSYEAKMAGIEALKGSDIRVDCIRNVTLQVKEYFIIGIEK